MEKFSSSDGRDLTWCSGIQLHDNCVYLESQETATFSSSSWLLFAREFQIHTGVQSSEERKTSKILYCGNKGIDIFDSTGKKKGRKQVKVTATERSKKTSKKKSRRGENHDASSFLVVCSFRFLFDRLVLSLSLSHCTFFLSLLLHLPSCSFLLLHLLLDCLFCVSPLFWFTQSIVLRRSTLFVKQTYPDSFSLLWFFFFHSSSWLLFGQVRKQGIASWCSLDIFSTFFL